MITVYQANTTSVRAVINPDDRSQQSRGLMRDDTVTLSFLSPVYIAFGIGDYATVFGSTYKLNRRPSWRQTAARRFEYTVVMEGLQYDLTRVQYLMLNANNRFTQGKFSLRATPQMFCELIISNMERCFPGSGWRLGAVIEGDFQTLDFDGENCMEALSKVADAYKTEWIIEGNKLSLYQRQVNSGFTLEYGQGKALTSVGQENQDQTGIITRLFVYGSEKNLGKTYRNGAPRLRLPEQLYLEKNVDVNGVFEKTVVFDGSGEYEEIYPHRTGTVTGVTAPDTFADVDIPFNVNDYLMGTTNATQVLPAKLTFNTGLLAGVTFEVRSFNDASKTFIINPNTESQTIAMPSEDFKPSIGDEYVLTDIVMPDIYYTEAEAKLLARGQEVLNKEVLEKLKYPLTCNDNYFRQYGIRLVIGQLYNLLIPEAGLNINKRVISYVRNIRNPDKYECELADSISVQPLLIKLLNKL